jgi:hypothetical protein
MSREKAVACTILVGGAILFVVGGLVYLLLKAGNQNSVLAGKLQAYAQNNETLKVQLSKSVSDHQKLKSQVAEIASDAEKLLENQVPPAKRVQGFTRDIVQS